MFGFYLNNLSYHTKYPTNHRSRTAQSSGFTPICSKVLRSATLWPQRHGDLLAHGKALIRSLLLLRQKPGLGERRFRPPAPKISFSGIIQNHPSGDQMFIAKSSFGRSSLTRCVPDIWAPLGTQTACFGRPQLEGLTQPRFPPAGGQHKTFQHVMPWGLWIHHENHGKHRAKKYSNVMYRLWTG